jgi:molybdate transport system regulatory protein
MSLQEKHKLAFKIWLEHDGKPILGEGGAEILETVRRYESLSVAAKKLGMSYRYLWGYINRTEKILGAKVLETRKGGKTGGGGARLTEIGANLLEEYKQLEHQFSRVSSDMSCLEVIGLKISARNHFRGKVVAVEKNGVAALVKIEVTEPAVVTALISKEAVEDLKIKVGDTVEAVVKATEVMIAK